MDKKFCLNCDKFYETEKCTCNPITVVSSSIDDHKMTITLKYDWIRVEDQLPDFLGKSKDVSQYVWVTDGELIEIARFIFRPRNYGCAVDDDEEEATCGPQPHWHFEKYNAFIEGDISFGKIESNEITHWMPLPKPPHP